MVHAMRAGGILAVFMAVNAHAHLNNGEAYRIKEDPFSAWDDPKNKDEHSGPHRGVSVPIHSAHRHDYMSGHGDDAKPEERKGNGLRMDKPDCDESGMNTPGSDSSGNGDGVGARDHPEKNAVEEPRDDGSGKKAPFKPQNLPAGSGIDFMVQEPKAIHACPEENLGSFSSGIDAVDGGYPRIEDPRHARNDPIPRKDPMAPHHDVFGGKPSFHLQNSPLGGDDLAPGET